MKVRIEIDTRTFVRFWLVVIGFAFAILALYLAKTALFILGSAAFLALALNGPVSMLSKRIPGRNRTAASAVAFVALVVFLAGVVLLVVPPVTQQTMRFLDSAPQLVSNSSTQWESFGDVINKYNLQPQIDSAVASVQDNANSLLKRSGETVIYGVGSLFSFVVAAFLALVLAFLMLVEGPSWMKKLWHVYEDQEKMEMHQKLVERMNRVVSGFVVGQLSVSGIGALAAGATVFMLSLFIEGVPANLALPTIAVAFTLSLIPMFGATIAGLIITLLLLLNSPFAALIFAVYFIVYQQIENNFISPAIQSKYVELSPLAVLSSVTVGLYLLGLVGGIISIPIAGVIKVLIEDHLNHSRKKRAHSKKPLVKLANKIQNES